MSTYFGSSINESPTIVLPAGDKLTEARGIALAVKDGAAVKPEAGAHVIGISLIETDETVEKGSDIDIQIKDIGKWAAGEGSSRKSRRFYRWSGLEQCGGSRDMDKSPAY